MTPLRQRISLLNIAALVSAILAVAGAGAKTFTAADQRYVHADTFRVIQQGERDRVRDDSLRWAHVFSLLDSANLRLRQIQCGRRVESGCR